MEKMLSPYLAYVSTEVATVVSQGTLLILQPQMYLHAYVAAIVVARGVSGAIKEALPPPSH
jgi:hypothetical protein